MSSPIIEFDEEEAPIVSGAAAPDVSDAPAAAPDEPFPTDALPSCLQDPARALAVAVQVPESVTAPTILGAVSAALGKEVTVETFNGRTSPTNLYILISVPSAIGKSEVYKSVFKPIMDLEVNRLDDWKAKVEPQLQARLMLIEREIKQLCKPTTRAGQPDTPPEGRAERLAELVKERAELEAKLRPPRLLADNATSEALAQRLEANHEEITLASPEARDIFDILEGLYNKKTDESLLLKAFSADGACSDRVGRPTTILRTPWISAVFMVQPPKLQRLASNPGLRESGLLPRFLLARPQAPLQQVELEQENPFTGAVAEAWHDLVNSLFTAFRLARQPCVLCLADEARRLSLDYFNECRRVAEPMEEFKRAFVLRWAENAWRLAAVLHVAEHGAAARVTAVSGATMEAAIRIVRWFGRQQEKVVGSLKTPDQVLEEKLLSWAAGQVGEFNHTEVVRARICNKPQCARELLSRMERKGLLISREEKPEHGGHTAVYYRLPCVEEKFGAHEAEISPSDKPPGGGQEAEAPIGGAASMDEAAQAVMPPEENIEPMEDPMPPEEDLVPEEESPAEGVAMEGEMQVDEVPMEEVAAK